MILKFTIFIFTNEVSLPLKEREPMCGFKL